MTLTSSAIIVAPRASMEYPLSVHEYALGQRPLFGMARRLGCPPGRSGSGWCRLARIPLSGAGRRRVMGRLVEVADTRLYVEERGEPSGFPLLVFHGGPGLDHTEFGDYLDPLTQGGRYRLVLADERACGRSDRTAPARTWTLARMAQDVSDLAASLGVHHGYATLGH